MTRSDIEREFTVRDGSIVSRGKFEGEPVYAPYFWDLAMDVATDDDEYQFSITDKDRHLFPELGKAKTVRLAELDNGAVVTITKE